MRLLSGSGVRQLPHQPLPPLPRERTQSPRGRQASKKRYFYGFKVYLLVTSVGEPVEFFLSEGSLHDIEGVRRLPLDLPEGSNLWGDKAYQDQKEQWLLQDAAGVRAVALKRRNARQPLPQCLVYLTQVTKQQVETAFNLMDRMRLNICTRSRLRAS